MKTYFLALSIVIAIIASIGIKWFHVYHNAQADETSFLVQRLPVPSNFIQRLLGAIVWQTYYTPIPSLNKTSLCNQLILLTGGSKGIGLETAKGLVLRGAQVIITSRNEANNIQAVKEIRQEIDQNQKCVGSIDYALVDLSDLDDVVRLAKELKVKYPNKVFHQLILNSGVWPSDYVLSKQGYEMAFATNVLGHHLLFKKLIGLNMLSNNAKVLILTGDIYITETNCTTDFKYNAMGGAAAYSRSKICVNWLFNEYVSKYPKYRFNLIHPGVVASELAGKVDYLKAAILIDTKQGAATTLICASPENETLLVNGGYYHNTYGLMTLPSDDIANNRENATRIWNEVEKILKPYL